MTRQTQSTTSSELPEKTASTVEKRKKTRPSRMRKLLRRLAGRSKARKVDVEQLPPRRTLEEVAAQYAPDERPEHENKEAAADSCVPAV
jgi:hypothetical protein